MIFPPPPVVEEQPFALLPLPGKGIGVIATRAIPANHLLFAEGPIMLLSQAATKRDAVLASFAMLSKPAKTAYLSLANGFSEPGLLEETEANILGVWKSNNFCLDDEGISNAVFILSSRLNHACIGGENCRWEFEMDNEDDGRPVMRFYTDRTIEVSLHFFFE